MAPTTEDAGFPFRPIDRRPPALDGDLLSPSPTAGDVNWRSWHGVQGGARCRVGGFSQARRPVRARW